MHAQDLESGVQCPSCGRYAGPYEICQHCQASLETRLSLKLVKWIAVAGSILGLILLWIGVKYREIPTVQIGEIDLQYNLAIVKLEGTVIEANLDKEKNTFRITIDDGTGQAVLNGFGKLTMFQEVMKDSFPRTGDTIQAIGNLSVSESWGITMFLTSPRRLIMRDRPEIKALKFGALTLENSGIQGLFAGEIVDVKSFGKGRSLILRDSTGEMSVTVFNSELLGCSDEIIEALSQPGATIRFLGRAETFRNRLQLRLIQPDKAENLALIKGQEP